MPSLWRWPHVPCLSQCCNRLNTAQAAPLSPAEARSRGLKHYRRKPCKYGHDSLRDLKGNCLRCREFESLQRASENRANGLILNHSRNKAGPARSSQTQQHNKYIFHRNLPSSTYRRTVRQAHRPNIRARKGVPNAPVAIMPQQWLHG